jgi:hypothetical protein
MERSVHPQMRVPLQNREKVRSARIFSIKRSGSPKKFDFCQKSNFSTPEH